MTLRENEASDEAWAKATRIARELGRILDGQEPVRTAVARAASELRLSTRQVYNHLRRYRTERRVSSLLPKTGGARRARISPAVEEIIAATLRELWLRPEQPDLAPIVDEIRTRCVSEGLDPPAYVTVSKRIPRLFTPEEIARRRHSGGKSLRRLKPRPVYIRAKHALDVVQIDHTPADIIHELSEGLIGEVVDIVSSAAIKAIRNGEEQISEATITSLGYTPLSKRRNAPFRREMM